MTDYEEITERQTNPVVFGRLINAKVGPQNDVVLGRITFLSFSTMHNLH
jgi:hypothetical protein